MKKIKQLFCWHKWDVWLFVDLTYDRYRKTPNNLRVCKKCHKMEEETIGYVPRNDIGGYQPGNLIIVSTWKKPHLKPRIRAHEYFIDPRDNE